MKYILALTVLLLFTGCQKQATCPAPTIITEYKEKKVPVRCNVDIPPRPVYDRNQPITAAQMLQYFELVENRLGICINGSYTTK